ncbi:PKD domain-containing protein, partial [Chloroflexota bacterium]
DGYLLDTHPQNLRLIIDGKILTSTQTLPLNVLTHVAGTYDGSQMKIYINGVLVNNAAATVAIPMNTLPLRIGADSNGQNLFKGLIDEVSLFNRALSDAEMWELFNAGVPGGFFTDPDADIWTATVDYGDGTGVQPLELTPDKTFSLSHTYTDDSNYTVIVTVTDDDGGVTIGSTTITVNNVAPTITSVSNSGPINEGSSATVTVTATDPAGASDPLSYEFDFDNDGSYETGPQLGKSASSSFGDDGSYQVNVRVTDGDGGVTIGSTTVTVNNVAPTVGVITAPVDPAEVNTEINVSADFTDPGILDTHTAVWDWGDETTTAGTVSETNGSGIATGTHTYIGAGVYTVTLTITDKDGASGESVYQFIVIYDPDSGFVTGGGWIDSPEGAYTPDTSITGKATFGFISRYHRGADIPVGETEFQFHVVNLKFHSESYQWLVVANAKAMYKGTGTINGVGNYGFMISAIDEKLTPSTDVDLFRIKIWDKDNGNIVVYDNQLDAEEDADPTTQLRSGNIVIHSSWKD